MLKLTAAKAERGQSLVEVALSLPILVLIVCGLIDLGRLYFTYVALEDVAGEAALYLSINPGCKFATDGPQCADPNNAYYRAKTAAGSEVDWSKVTLTMDVPEVHGVGDPVKASIKYQFQLITPIIPKSSGLSQIQLSNQATQIIISE